MAAFWLTLALAFCALYFAVGIDTNDGDADPGLVTDPSGGQDNPSTTTNPSTDGTTKTPGVGPIILPGTTNATDNSTDTTQPTTVNGTSTPENVTTTTPGSETTTTPGNETTGSPTSGTMPTTNGTMPSTNETTPSSNDTTSPTPVPTESTPPTPGNPPASNPVPPGPPMPPTGWIYPGLLWPPMQPLLSSSLYVDNSDSQMSDLSGDILIEDFQETITIHKKTIRKHQDKFEKENSDVSSGSDVDYSY